MCLTGKTPFHVERLLPQAIQCFLNQTYSNRELLLVTEQQSLELQEDLYNQAPKAIRMISVPGATSVGELRNAGLDAAKGQLAIQWDDDDWHHPERMSIQVNVWLNMRLPVFFQRQLAYSFVTNTACVREFPDTFIHGTVLHENLTSVRYSHTSMGEDSAFIKQFDAHAVVDNDPCLYLRFSHGRNSWDDRHIMRQATGRRDHWEVTEEQAAFLRGVLKGYDLTDNSLARAPQPASIV